MQVNMAVDRDVLVLVAGILPLAFWDSAFLLPASRRVSARMCAVYLRLLN